MHPSAMSNAQAFFDTYLKSDHPGYFLIEIGSQIVPNVTTSLREICPANAEFVGVDFAKGKGVDVVLTDPYTLPFEDNSVDVCMSSSVFEHSEMFWLLFLETLRILKPGGLLYINVPSNGHFHRYPVDCWRFYPDSGTALVNWARRSGLNTILLESFTSAQKDDVWNDFVAVFLKDAGHLPSYPQRIVHTNKDFSNGLVHGTAGFINFKEAPEDALKLHAIGMIASGKMPVR